jgi:hypothetical protein
MVFTYWGFCVLVRFAVSALVDCSYREMNFQAVFITFATSVTKHFDFHRPKRVAPGPAQIYARIPNGAEDRRELTR